MSDSAWIGEARQLAAQCWCDPETSDREMDVALAEAVARRIAAWMDTAAEYARNQEYYVGLLDRAARALGPEAFTCDDGSHSEEPLRAKVPELVERLVAVGATVGAVDPHASSTGNPITRANSSPSCSMRGITMTPSSQALIDARELEQELRDERHPRWANVIRDLISVIEQPRKEEIPSRAGVPCADSTHGDLARRSHEGERTMKSEQPSNGVALIAAERQRQIDAEGWTPEHDDKYADSELVRAAICYAHSGSGFSYGSDCNHAVLWPWEPSWFKPRDMERDLVKAGALIAAEIDRLRREQAPSHASRP